MALPLKNKCILLDPKFIMADLNFFIRSTSNGFNSSGLNTRLKRTWKTMLTRRSIVTKWSFSRADGYSNTSRYLRTRWASSNRTECMGKQFWLILIVCACERPVLIEWNAWRGGSSNWLSLRRASSNRMEFEKFAHVEDQSGEFYTTFKRLVHLGPVLRSTLVSSDKTFGFRTLFLKSAWEHLACSLFITEINSSVHAERRIRNDHHLKLLPKCSHFNFL